MSAQPSPPSPPVASAPVRDNDLLAVTALRLWKGETPHQIAQAPCEHGNRYRGVSPSCGYCLALADMAEASLDLADAALAARPSDDPAHSDSPS